MNRRRFIRDAFAWTGLIFVPRIIRASANDLSDPQFLAQLASTGVALDSEVTDWKSRVIANGGAVSGTTLTAVNTFMLAIKAAGLRSLIYRLNCYAGTGGTSGLVVPLIKDFGNALDSIIGGLTYSEASGATSGALSTGFVPSSVYSSVNSGHLAIYGRTAGAESSVAIGGVISGSAPTQTELLIRFAGAANGSYGLFSEIAGATVTDAFGFGFYQHNRTSGSVSALYRNGSSIATGAPSGGTLLSVDIYVHAQHDSASGAQFLSNRTYAGYSIGLGMDATQSLAFYNAWQNFQTALSRQV